MGRLNQFFRILPVFLIVHSQWTIGFAASWKYADPARYPDLQIPEAGPYPGEPYMVDNSRNYYKTAPDKGKSNGAVWRYSGSLEKFMDNLSKGKIIRGGYKGRKDTTIESFTRPKITARQNTDYWLPQLAVLGIAPFETGDYQFFRDVTEFGADNTGKTDTTEAINAAVSSWNEATAGGNKTRCGMTCGNTFSQGAIVYFPPGTYKICRPIIQYYYTQFIGDPNDPPTIKGCDEFEGIGLIDVDPYIPGGSGAQWYINQNQFFRQIRNFIFDLKDMPLSTAENDQPLVPTGIHWQVAQATSLQNIVFNMPEGKDVTHVGVFTENGSGGFVSDLVFNGGAIGWRVGSQQFTARGLRFNKCQTAVQMIWDWGFNWQDIKVDGGAIAFNISGIGGDQGQGIGSVSIIDSEISNVPVGILTHNLAGKAPNIVLDNTVFNNVQRVVQVNGGDTILTSAPKLWAMGKRYMNGSQGSTQSASVTAPAKGKSLLSSNGKLFTRSRPQYEKASRGDFLIATSDGGCKNDATGDQADCLNTFFNKALSQRKIAYLPAGVYAVGHTVFIPTGSRVVGASWSQIMGSGYYFGDMQSPKVMVKVGNRGDIGTMEITDILFSVRGATAGAIMVEWNVAESKPGAAGMWDAHFRVGGAKGSDLDFEHCAKFTASDNCIAATLLFHVTRQASGYFENVWVWLADHDNDKSIYKQPDSSSTQISLFGARCMLVESQGPAWFYGGGSEHCVLYNYMLSGAKDIYMGHIQTESPYFQPKPPAPWPFDVAPSYPNDPDFSNCQPTAEVWDEQCRYAWGLLIINSTDVTIHSAGLYSFFNEYYQDCIDTNNCQSKVLRVAGSTGVAIFNLFTVAIVEMANGIDGTKILQKDAGNQKGFTTEVSVWVPRPGQDNVNIVYVGPEVFEKPVVSCPPPCLLVFPPSTLDKPITVHPIPYTVPLEYGRNMENVSNGITSEQYIATTTIVTITIESVVVRGMPYSNFNITKDGPTPVTLIPSVDLPPGTVQLPDGEGGTTKRIVPLPPWPLVDQGPGGFVNPANEEPKVTDGLTSRTTYYYRPRTTINIQRPTVTTINFPTRVPAATLDCPETTTVVFATPSITIQTVCRQQGPVTINYECPPWKVFTFLSATTAVVGPDCSLITVWPARPTGGETTTTEEEPLPTYVDWPNWGRIVPVARKVDEPEEDDDGVVIPCAAWFFFICISWPGIEIGGWLLSLPTGILPPGPAPIHLIEWPPGIEIKGNLPPWPRITIGPGKGQIRTENEPSCQTRTASACTVTTFFSATTTRNGVTTTTATSTSQRCEIIRGCSVSDSEESTTTEQVEFGTQTAAAMGSLNEEGEWPARDQGAAFSSSVFARLAASIARDSALHAGGATRGAKTIDVTADPAFARASPTCTSGTGCGGKLCTGFWCKPTPVGTPPGIRDPKDPNSSGFEAPTSHVGDGTTTSSGTGPSPVPLSRGPINCHRESDFPGHADIQSDDQHEFSVDFSGLFASDVTIGPGDAPITLRKTDSHGVNYDYKAEWISGCETTVDRQGFQFPLGPSQSLITAYLLVREDYTKCSNGGVGGSCQVGCLLYTFTGGLGDFPSPPVDPCKDIDCRSCDTLFDPPECQTCCRGKMRKVAGGAGGTTSGSGTSMGSRNGTVFIPAGQPRGPAVVPVVGV
ncbi:glucan-beta-glucosidase [Naviculisporaceae sp. PSN 640]